MRVLIITQKVDREDSYFGFFPAWIDRFARECEQVTVIALERRAGSFADNVTVLSLGKEQQVSRVRYFLRLTRYAWRYRRDYDAVFCHMSPLYVLAGWPVWKLVRKPVALWYVHKQVDLKLRLATLLADRVFTATPESFRVSTPKVRYMGQGVDADLLGQGSRTPAAGPMRLLTVGRITPIKRIEVLLEALRGLDATLTVIGAPVMPADHAYAESLTRLTEERGLADRVTWRGSVPFKDIAAAYHAHDATVNLAPTGGLDKVVLESLAAGTPAFVANRAFGPLLGEYADRFLADDAQALTQKIAAWRGAEDAEAVRRALAARVRDRYGLDRLVHEIVEDLDGLRSY